MKEKKDEIEKIKKFRRRFYNTHATDYDDMAHDDDFLEEFEGFIKLVKVKAGQVVLDIATGTGRYLIQMAKSGALCYGIDQSPKMLKHLSYKIKKESIKRNIKKISVGAADSLPYTNHFFDWITCIGMFEYYPLEYVKIVLSEIARVIKQNGYIFIDIADPFKIYAQERDWIFSYDLEKFKTTVGAIGLKIETCNSAGYMLQYLLSKKSLKC
ncbi:hypothetical protein LCGC14_2835500 [marine sediment metagenome]|uniref:Methyltransferase type 11 domain-containing protein n=1 Tax=marine sediment metagenome TaxID=412755 RepID=A0A0F8YCX6_9ZZZZ